MSAAGVSRALALVTVTVTVSAGWLGCGDGDSATAPVDGAPLRDAAAADGAMAVDAAVFDAAILGPTVIAETPVAGAIGVEPELTITATFDTDVIASTVGASSFVVRRNGGAPVSGEVTYDVASRTATFRPKARLVLLGDYTATLTTAITSAAGFPLDFDHAWSFTIRDGVWGNATVLQDNGSASSPAVVMDSTGAATAVWDSDQNAMRSAWVSRFVPGAGWSPAELL
jgi:hypothetical protein